MFPASLQRNLRRLAVGTCLGLLGGCSGPQLVPVHGKVVYQNAPLRFGSVMFQPVGGGPIARASIQPDGTFELANLQNGQGAAPGKYLIRITAYEGQQNPSTGSADQEPTLGRLLIPQKYTSFRTSELIAEVTHDMELPIMLTLDEE